MHVVIRTDASILIGSGHVMRCLTLASRLRKHGHKVSFICRDHTGNLIAQIARAGFDFVVLPALTEAVANDNSDDYSAWLGVDQVTDADQTRAAINSQPDWLIVDHYGIDRQWEQKLRSATGKILVIDDLANRSHDCDLLLDQNYSTTPDRRYAELVPSGCTRLIGPTYALLRPEFAEVRETLDTGSRGERINVFFGGVDATGETIKFLDALTDGGFEECRFDVVVGGKNQRRNRILKLASHHGSVSIHENVENMAELFGRATIALGAGGTTVWERCCLGLPSVLVSVAENQVTISKEVEAAGAAIYLGKAQEVSGTDMAQTVADLLQDTARLERMRTVALGLTDGSGCERVVAALTKAVGVPT